MSSTQSTLHLLSRWIPRLPKLRFIVGAGVLLTVVGFGIHSFLNRRVEVIDDSELQVLDELVADETAEAVDSQPRPLAKATITDVVPAVHHHASDEFGGRVQLAAHANGARPESKPPVWLSGTIEDSAAESPGNRQRAITSPSQRFNR